MEQSWYCASLFFEAVHEIESPPPSLWEEVVVLIRADDEASATRQAEEMGRAREVDYFVQQPQTHRVRWRFVSVERVCQIDSPELASGTELFSRFLRPQEAASLLTPFED